MSSICRLSVTAVLWVAQCASANAGIGAASYDAGYIEVHSALIGKFSVNLAVPHRSSMPVATVPARAPLRSGSGASFSELSGASLGSFDASLTREQTAFAGLNDIDAGLRNTTFTVDGPYRGMSAPLVTDVVAAVPEPSTSTAMILGLIVLGFTLIRIKQKSRLNS